MLCGVGFEVYLLVGSVVSFFVVSIFFDVFIGDCLVIVCLWKEVDDDGCRWLYDLRKLMI